MFFLHVVFLKLLKFFEVHGLVDLLYLFFEDLQFLFLGLLFPFGELFFHKFVLGLCGLVLFVKLNKLHLRLLPPFLPLLDPFYSFLDALPPLFFLLRPQTPSSIQCLFFGFQASKISFHLLSSFLFLNLQSLEMFSYGGFFFWIVAVIDHHLLSLTLILVYQLLEVFF